MISPIYMAQINPIIGDIGGNGHKIIASIENARKAGARLIVFPEMCLTGYPPEDFLLMSHFMDAVERQLQIIIMACSDITAVIGMPRKNPAEHEKTLCNSAAIIRNQVLLGFQDKMLLPTYDVFSEARYFEPGATQRIWEWEGKKLAVTICEDIWHHADMIDQTRYRRDPIEELKDLEPDLVLNLSASPFHLEKPAERLLVCQRAAASLKTPIFLCNQVGGNDSLIFDGHSMVVNAKGELTALLSGFKEDFLLVTEETLLKPIDYRFNPIEELHDALVLGLRDYFAKASFNKACIALSGGIDSAVVTCLAKEALGEDKLLAVTMPSRYTSKESIEEAKALASHLGITLWDMSIENPFQSFLDLLEPRFKEMPFDATEENLQARCRGVIMMAISNKLGHIVLSTGNKSELAVGYATLYGDMCGGLGVISDCTKNQVYQLAEWINRKYEVIPKNTLTKPPSAELRPNQKDADSLPDYAVLDAILQDYILEHLSPEVIASKRGYPIELVNEIVVKVHRNEYKRRQSPPGLRVSSRAFSVGRRFPIVQKWV